MAAPTQITIRVRSSSAAVLREVRSLPATIRGTSLPVAKKFFVRLGLIALQKISQEFLVKSRGGTDDSGQRWRLLKAATIRHSLGRLRRIPHPQGSLTEPHRALWQRIYKRTRSARAAWAAVHRQGGATLLQRRAGAAPLILIDSGRLYTSLSPARPPEAAGAFPVRMPEQVFQVEPGAVTVGTNRPHAHVHHRGRPPVPRRALWPEPNEWAPDWWERLLVGATTGTVEVLRYLLGRL